MHPQADDDNTTGTKYPFKITNVTSLEKDSNMDVESAVYPFVITNVASGAEAEAVVGTANEEKLPKKQIDFCLPHEVPNLISQVSEKVFYFLLS